MVKFTAAAAFAVTNLLALVRAAPAPQAPAPAPAPASSSSYWLASIQRQGTVAYGESSDFKIYRNVKDYGATGQYL